MMKLSLGAPKFRKSGNVIRKRNRMAPEMGISKILKNVKYSRQYVDSEYEENYLIASLSVEILA